MLLAVDHPLVAFQLGASGDVGGIGGGHPGFGHGKGGADLPIEKGFQPLALLCLAAVLVQHLHIAGVRSRTVEHLGRKVGLAHFLSQVGVFHRIQAGAVFAIGQEEVPQPGAARLVLEPLENLALSGRELPAVTDRDFRQIRLLQRQDFILHKGFHLCQQRPNLFTDAQIHAVPLVSYCQNPLRRA